MSTFQQIIIEGFLGDDPKFVTFENNQCIANISVATTEKWKDKTTKEEKSWTEWHRVVLRNQLAQLAESYLKKGSKVLIVGKMRTRMWEKDGVKHYSTELNADSMRFMGTKSDGFNEKAKQQASQETPQSNNVVEANSSDEPDDLPF